MAESKLAVASLDFAVKILKLCDGIKGRYSIVNQLERSATSIVQIFVRRITLIVNLILFLNYKYHSKSVMKQNIGLNLCLKPTF